MLIDISKRIPSEADLVIRVRHQLGSHQTRFLAYTTHGLSEETEIMKVAGFDSTLTKPLSCQSMLEAVR